jgi:hypothetical protein
MSVAMCMFCKAFLSKVSLSYGFVNIGINLAVVLIDAQGMPIFSTFARCGSRNHKAKKASSATTTTNAN